MKLKYYSLDKILSENCDYNLIIGERSNGKTTSVQGYALQDNIDSWYNNQLAIVRRWEEDFKGAKGQQLFANIVSLGWVEKYSKGKFNSIYYYSQRWYLCKYNEKGVKVEQAPEPFAIGFALSSQEHYKSTSYPNITTVLFDEFLTREFYLPDEFIKFQNLLSTIIRNRDNVKIFMCGNTVNKYCPYFSEMGLHNIKHQIQGTIDVYTYGTSDLKVAVEYCESISKKYKKKSNKYFAFDNSKLKMITEGRWEIDIYPHIPVKYVPKDIKYHFYIVFDKEILQANVIGVNNSLFIYIHRKTSPIREDNKQLVYQQSVDYRPNYRLNIFKPQTQLESKILQLVKCNKVFYQDNEVGEIINNYIKWCTSQ